jgi:ParB family chromosome partitioning protein
MLKPLSKAGPKASSRSTSLLTETHVAVTDRRAVFVGVEAYTEAVGTTLRDLFTEDRGGYFEDVALLDLLVTAKLGREADALREAEGWKLTEVHLDFPHAHGMRRTYPHRVDLSDEDQAVLEAAQCEVDQLAEWNQTADQLPDHVEARLCELEAVSERLEAKRQAWMKAWTERTRTPTIISRCRTS